MYKRNKLSSSKRAISQLLAVLITIAIVIAGGSFVALIFVNNIQVISGSAQLSIQSVNLVKSTDGNVAFAITIKNTGTRPINSLIVQLSTEQHLPVTVPVGGLEPGKSVSVSASPTGSYISGQTYLVGVEASFSGGSSVAQSASVVCQGSGQTLPTPTPSQSPLPSPTPSPSLPPQPTWLSGWNYRVSHVIEPAVGAGTDYQVQITVHFGSGTSSGSDVFLNGLSKTDFGDIRFTDGDGTTPLSYWMESEAGSNYATFWVKIPDDLSTKPATIYMYYGNPTATTTSNGTSTFILFDDLTNMTGWNAVKTYFYDQNSWSISQQSGTIIQGDIWDTDNNVRGYFGKTYDQPVNREFKIGFYNMYQTNYWGDIWWGMGAIILGSDGKTYRVSYANSAGHIGLPSANIGVDTSMTDSHMANWRVSEFDPLADLANAGYQVTPTQISMVFAGMGAYAHEGYGYLDWFYVRAYVPIEPVNSAWGTPETSGT